MNFSKFFIDRPIFAAVLSLLIVAAGALERCSPNSTPTRPTWPGSPTPAPFR